MERSRSKRSSNYHYDHDSDPPTPPSRSKPRRHHPYPPAAAAHHHRRPDRRPIKLPSPPPPPPPLASAPATTATSVFRILCPEIRATAVVGKSGNSIKLIRQKTGSWISVHEIIHGDNERIIETSDSMRRDPDGRPPQFSPAQDALILIHERIVDTELEFGSGEDGDEFGGGWERSGRGRITTRLVVPRSHVGCLLGKGGKIIEQMRMETKTHIRILPRDQYTPQCVSPSEEVVQVVGEGICVKKAVEIISSRLLESLHRDRGPFRGRLHSPEQYFPHDDDFMNNAQSQSAPEGFDVGSRSSTGANRARNKLHSSNSSRFAFDSDGNQAVDNSQSLSSDDIIFRILCPNEKVENVMGVSDGIIEMLRSDIGVDVKVCDPVPGSDERVIVITSEEGPDDDLFPAQEALLHIQTNIVDLGPDKDNIITTRLLVPASEIGCLEGRDGSLSDIQKLTSANVQILPKEDHPLCAMDADELIQCLQIVGEIRAARNALVQITARLRSHLFRDLSIPKDLLVQSNSASNHASSVSAVEPSSPVKNSPLEGYQGSDPSASVRHNTHAQPTTWQSKETGGVASGPLEQDDSTINDEGRRSMPRRLSAPLVTKTTLEVIIPEHAVRSLTMRSGSKLAQISTPFCLNSCREQQLAFLRMGLSKQTKSLRFPGHLIRLKEPRACFRVLY